MSPRVQFLVSHNNRQTVRLSALVSRPAAIGGGNSRGVAGQSPASATSPDLKKSVNQKAKATG